MLYLIGFMLALINIIKLKSVTNDGMVTVVANMKEKCGR
jgi:hypothetical protein